MKWSSAARIIRRRATLRGGLIVLLVTLAAASIVLLNGMPGQIPHPPEGTANIADIFWGNRVGQSFQASHDRLCRVDIRLRPVLGECRVAFRLWAAGSPSDDLGGHLHCNEDGSYTARFPPFADSEGEVFHWEVGLADPSADGIVGTRVTAHDHRPDGTLLLNGKPVPADAVFTPYYCGMGAVEVVTTEWFPSQVAQLRNWIDRQYEHFVIDLLMFSVATMGALLVLTLILPSPPYPLNDVVVYLIRSGWRRLRAQPLAALEAVSLIVLTLATVGLMTTSHISWGQASTRLTRSADVLQDTGSGPWVVYDFIAALSAPTTVIDTPEEWYVSPGWLDLEGDQRPVIDAHPPSHIHYTLEIPPGGQLHAAVALNPEAWASEGGNGVLFIVQVRSDQGDETLYYREIDPKSNLEDRRWHDVDVDLSTYAGQTVTLTFTTYPMETNAWDWAAWGAPVILVNDVDLVPSWHGQ